MRDRYIGVKCYLIMIHKERSLLNERRVYMRRLERKIY